jgi:hypothetical protein
MTEIFDQFKKYPLLIINLNNAPESNMSIIDVDINASFSNNILYPEIVLGFQHFIHATKDKMEQIEQFENRKKVYLVTSLFVLISSKFSRTLKFFKKSSDLSDLKVNFKILQNVFSPMASN